MMRMLRFELKKIIVKPANLIAFALLAAILCFVCYSAVTYQLYVDENGDKIKGPAAVQALRKEKSKWEGPVTEEVLLRVLEENTLINLFDDVSEEDKAYSKKQGFEDIREMINRAYSGFREYNYYRVDSVTKEDISSFYDRRTVNLTEWLNGPEQGVHYSEKEKQFLAAKYNELETPFYYEYAGGWEALLHYAPSVNMLFTLITGFLVSGIFSDEIQLKADSIFFSSKPGRNKAIAAKIGAGLIVITCIYGTAILLYSGIVLSLLGTGGAGCAIQNGFSYKSFYHITYLQTYLLTVLGGYLGNLFILTLSMLASAKARSKVLAVTIPFILLFIPSFLSGISALSEVLGLLPDQLLQMCRAVQTFNLYQFGDHIAGAVPILLIMYTILFCLLVPVIYQIYRKTEVK